MGTWGTGLFENDWAMDWASELLETGDAELPASTLWGFDGAESLDPQERAEALAAAEAIAASARQPAVGLPDQVRMWVERTGARADAEEVQLALRVVGVILEQNAELRDQQDETGDSLEKWLTPIDDLRRRLTAAERRPQGRPCPARVVGCATWLPAGARPAAGCGTAGLVSTVCGGRCKEGSCFLSETVAGWP